MGTYSVFDLGGLTGSDACMPMAVAQVGAGWAVTGSATIGSQSFSFLESDSIPLQALSAPTGPSDGSGSAVNALGDVVGTFNAGGTPPVPNRAFLRTHAGTTLDLQTPLLQGLGSTGSFAVALNGRPSPDVVGFFFDTGGNQHPWYYAGDTHNVIDLTGVLPSKASVSAISDARQILGVATNELFLYDLTAGALTTITNIPGHPIGARFCLNNAGQILGDTEFSLFVRQPNGAYIRFGGADAGVGGMNNSGQVVFVDTVKDPVTNQLLSSVYISDPIPPSASSAPATQDLNTLLSTPGWKLYNAFGIDDAGVIVGQAQFNGGPVRGVRLVPDPVSPLNIYEAAFATILFGIINDGGGIQFPGGRVPPDGPDGPWMHLTIGQRDAVLGLALNAGATLISDQKARVAMEAQSAQLVRDASQRLNLATGARGPMARR